MSEKNVPEVRFRGFSGEWETFNWENTVDVSTNMVDPRTGEFDELPHIGPGNIEAFSGKLMNNVKSVREDCLISGKFHFFQNDIIYGKINPQLGKYVIAPCEGLSSADTYILNTKNGIGQLFLFSLLQTKDFFKYTISVSMRSGMPKINRDELNVYNFCAPTFPEQTKIGEFFKNLDDLIAQNQKKYDKLVHMKKACLDKMFPKDGADTPEVRFQGFSGEWEKCNLKEASQSLEYGLNAAAIKFDGKNKYIRITDIDDELRIFLVNDLSSPCINLVNSENYKLQKGDIVFARTGASVGKSYKYNETDGLLYYAGFLIRSRIKPEYDTTFIFQNTLTKKYKKYIQITSQRSGQPGVNAKEYSEFSFCAPIFDEQTKIGIFFQTLDNLITLRKTELEKLKNIKKACLDKMFI